ncbi:paired amphipathic helix protein Sin3b-like [Stegodyphus dumicola]|uniref:paired amphipathic helix protein Sin3b-like n=1 Tax=Stegodyphus dumicola TaxID=202533 RepID=UPI0015B146DF|nr:paired amphipathic helix protein Sin3b-like [Stegodyphus dumicola]
MKEKLSYDLEFKSINSCLFSNMEKKRLQQLAYKQQADHLTQAHTQAMKLLIEGQQKFKLSVNDALSYLELAKSKLGAAQFCEFMQIMKKCKEPNCDAINTISRICCLLQGHPELLQGFGMFLPPSLNLQLQTSGSFLIKAMKNQTSDSNSFMQANGEKFQNYYSFGEVSPVINGEGLDDSMDYLNESLLEEKEIYATKEVDDDYAILFLSKVKERFLNVPDVFEKFLQLLDSVRKDCIAYSCIVKLVNAMMIQVDKKDLKKWIKNFV